MLRVGRILADDTLLSPMLDRFARWHAVRAAAQALTFFLTL
jgi:hypothetical protein